MVADFARHAPRLARAVACASGLVLGACDRGAAPTKTAAPATASSALWFEEVAVASGLDFTHVRALQKRFWFPEIMGAGLCWLDYDGDGRPDLFCVQSGDLEPGNRPLPGSKLFHNLGGGRFEDVTERSGLGAPGYGMGCTAGDYDGDGKIDLYVTRVGPNVLWHNEGDGTFRDVTAAAGVGDAGWGTSTGFFDCDGDLDLDLVVVNYVRWKKELELPCTSVYGDPDYCAPNNYNAPSQCILYVNDGHGHFTDGSAKAGLNAVFGNGLGLGLGDFDGDGKPDIYVSNDGNPNQLWINRGDGLFVDEALIRGCAVNANGASEASMGTVLVDYDQDGDIDVFITNLRGESNMLYENVGNGRMRDVTARAGVTVPSLQFTGFGDALADFDHDEFIDLFVGNGRVGFSKPLFSNEDVYAEPKQLFRGTPQKRFDEIPHGGLAADLLGNSRGLACADYDDDGDLDIAINENNGHVRLLRNIAAKHGHWTELSVLNRAGAPALGARLTIVAGKQTLQRTVSVCSSYCSANDPRVHCGLGATTNLESVTVRWPDGTSETFGPIPADRIEVLRQGGGSAAR